MEVALRQERSAEEYRRAHGRTGAGREFRQIVEALSSLGRADALAALPDVEPLELNRWIADHLSERHSTICPDEVVQHTVRSAPSGSACTRGFSCSWSTTCLITPTSMVSPVSPSGSSPRAREGDVALLVVEDTGQGIADETFRASSSRSSLETRPPARHTRSRVGAVGRQTYRRRLRWYRDRPEQSRFGLSIRGTATACKSSVSCVSRRSNVLGHKCVAMRFDRRAVNVSAGLG